MADKITASSFDINLSHFKFFQWDFNVAADAELTKPS